MKKHFIITTLFIAFFITIFTINELTALNIGKYYYIKAYNSQAKDAGYWDLPGYNPKFKKGVRLQLYKYDKGKDRKFMLTPSGKGWYYISPKSTTFSRYFRGTVDIFGKKIRSGSKVGIWKTKYRQHDNQRFKLREVEKDVYKIFSKASGGNYIICTEKNSYANGTKLIVRKNNNSNWCKWYLIDAGYTGALSNALNSIKDKTEVTGGWDRYIYAWADRKIPNQKRYVAIRSIYKKNKHDMGNFWDVPGDNYEIKGPNKTLQLWEMKYKFQKYPNLDRRYKLIPLWEKTKKKEDLGYYLIMAGTGYYAYQYKKTVENPFIKNKVRTYYRLKLDRKNIYNDKKYHFNIINKGKNRFLIQSRESGKYITASGDPKKNGTTLTFSTKASGKALWEFIIIANGNEKKTTEEMAQKRAAETKKFVKKEVNRLQKIAKANGYKFRIGATKVITKTLKEITGWMSGPSGFENKPYMENDKDPSDIPSSIKRDYKMQSFNWRDNGYMTPIKYQESCGSCWAFASTAVFEGVYRIVKGTTLDLSEQYLVDCTFGKPPKYNNACNGGRSERVFELLTQFSHLKESKMPYQAVKQQCYGTFEVPYKVRRWGWVSSNRKKSSTEEIKKALCKYGPIAASVQVTDVWRGYKSGIIKIDPSGDKTNHAIVIVGWDDTKKAFLIRNSWDSDWGEGGYCWVDYNSSNISWATWIRIQK